MRGWRVKRGVNVCVCGSVSVNVRTVQPPTRAQWRTHTHAHMKEHKEQRRKQEANTGPCESIEVKRERVTCRFNGSSAWENTAASQEWASGRQQASQDDEKTGSYFSWASSVPFVSMVTESASY